MQKGLIPVSEQERWTRTIDPARCWPKLNPSQTHKKGWRSGSAILGRKTFSPAQAFAASASFFQVRLGALTTNPS